MSLDRGFPGLMKVDGVLIVEDPRRQVCDAAKPCTAAEAFTFFDVAKVGVRRRHMRRARVHDEADAGSKKVLPLARHFSRECFGHAAFDCRDIDAAFFEQGPLLENTRATAAALGA